MPTGYANRCARRAEPRYRQPVRKVELVHAQLEIANRVPVGGRGNVAECEHVGPVAPKQQVRALAADQQVVAAVAEQLIDSAAAIEPVVFAKTGQDVVSAKPKIRSSNSVLSSSEATPLFWAKITSRAQSISPSATPASVQVVVSLPLVSWMTRLGPPPTAQRVGPSHLERLAI